MKYLAIINTPGYLPQSDETPEFDTAQEAWEYLCTEREYAEENSNDDENYSATRETLAVLSTIEHWRGDTSEWLASFGLNRDGTGTIYGDTPGYDGTHDLGVAYTVITSNEQETN